MRKKVRGMWSASPIAIPCMLDEEDYEDGYDDDDNEYSRVRPRKDSSVEQLGSGKRGL